MISNKTRQSVKGSPQKNVTIVEDTDEEKGAQGESFDDLDDEKNRRILQKIQDER